MTGLFEVIAADQKDERLASRKTILSIEARINDRFGDFFRQATSRDELTGRFALVEDDIRNIVQASVEEFNSDFDNAFDSIKSLIFAAESDEDDEFEDDRDEDEEKTSSVKVSRKPKLCPYHNEVVDISLSSGDPTAGFNAMSQHAWGDNHCQGKFDGKCNFKRDMVTQTYWDAKQEKAEQRRLDRAEQLEQQRLQEPTVEEPALEEPNFDEVSDSVEPDISEQLSEAPTAVGEGIGDGTVAIQHGSSLGNTSVKTARKNLLSKTADDNLGGKSVPSPKIDTRKWTPTTVKKIEADDPKGRNPTETVDIISTDRPKNLTDAPELSNLVERQDINKDTNPSADGEGGSWSENNGTDPVTDKVFARTDDVEKNPIREILLESQEGLAPESEIQQAIARFVEKV